MCACSQDEEEKWNAQIARLVFKEDESFYKEERDRGSQYSSLNLNIAPIGNAFLLRRLSIQRRAAIGARSGPKQVIIRNTHSLKEHVEDQTSILALKRSQSLITEMGHSAILMPRRSDRMRVEQQMFDVWSKEFLSYPAMSDSRDRSIRRSASNAMRKLSRGSLTGSLGKRSRIPLDLFENQDKKVPELHIHNGDILLNCSSERGVGGLTYGLIRSKRNAIHRSEPSPFTIAEQRVVARDPSKSTLHRSESRDTSLFEPPPPSSTALCKISPRTKRTLLRFRSADKLR